MSETFQDPDQFNAASDTLRRLSTQATFESMNQKLPPAATKALRLASTSISESTINELEDIRRCFLRFSKQPTSANWTSDPLAQAAECSRLSAFILDIILESPDRAAKQYEIAQADFLAAKNPKEAEIAATNAAICFDTASGNIEERINRARAAVNAAAADTIDSASCQIDLGEIVMNGNNQWGAVDIFKGAEKTLAKAGYREPPSGHDALAAMMKAAISGTGSVADVMRRAGETVAVRLLFYRLYTGLKNAYGPVSAENPGNPDEAARYANLIQVHQLLTPQT